MANQLDEEDYAALAGFRFELRQFIRFSEEAAIAAGLTPQQHQALLAIRASENSSMLVGDLAERLMLKPHSASELVRRLEEHDLIERRSGNPDRRQVHIELTGRARDVLAALSVNHLTELRRMRPLLQRLLDAL